MKKISLLISSCFIALGINAQNTKRHVNFKLIGRDSVNVSLSRDYFMIEDSCAEVMRYGHFDIKAHKFCGKFTDVSTANTSLVVAEGFYTDNGLKNGLFTTYYLNGKLQAKGNFKDDKYDGHWELYYDSGLPELTFDDIDGVCHITDAWDAKGNKTVDKGSGTYIYQLGKVYWTGKLLNGTPDGAWRLFNSEDISGVVMATEHFKKGKFHDGSTKFSDYTEASHMNLNMPVILPFANAEQLKVSPEACDGSGSRHIITTHNIPKAGKTFRITLARLSNLIFPG